MDCKTAQSLVIPYINKQLSDEDMEAFLKHIQSCKECYEELEIYYTVHFALQKLDQDDKASYNIQKMLKENLHHAESRVMQRRILHYLSSGVMLVAELFLVLMLFTQVELLQSGDIRHSTVYRVIYERTPEEYPHYRPLREPPKLWQPIGEEEPTGPVFLEEDSLGEEAERMSEGASEERDE